MIKEIINCDSDKLIIDLPKEYVGKELEVLIFSNSEIVKRKKDDKKEELLKEFERITKNRVKPKIKYYSKMEDEVNNDIF